MRRLCEIGSEVRAARKRRGFAHLEDLAKLVGVDRRRLSDLELGRRPLEPEAMGRLARLLHLPELESNPECSSGRGPRYAEAEFLNIARVSRPLYDPPRDRDQEVRRIKACQEDGRLMDFLRERHQARPDAGRVEAFLKSISSASWLEYVYPARELAHPEARPLRIAPDEVGYCHYALVHPTTYQAVGGRLWPCLGIRRNQLALLQFFNATVRTPKRTWTVDILQYSRRPGQAARWTVVEIDGDGHVTRWDKLKEEQVALPLLRLSDEQVRGGDASGLIERWLGS